MILAYQLAYGKRFCLNVLGIASVWEVLQA